MLNASDRRPGRRSPPEERSRRPDGALTPPNGACLHLAMPPLEPLTRRRAVDLVRVAAALCRLAG
ncbi:putative leader peptide [Streptomyces sp. NPDC093808]|uniref:putative leader peptide n=1 Tax=Streptomyces sp. NPDC093808 TaxID=3154985 RepID=UPI00344F7FC9